MRPTLYVRAGIVAVSGVISACTTDTDSTAPQTLTTAATVSPAVAGQTIYALTTSDRLIRFSAGDACTISGNVSIAGLAAGESLLGIDVRPATGQLYGLGSSSRSRHCDAGNVMLR